MSDAGGSIKASLSDSAQGMHQAGNDVGKLAVIKEGDAASDGYGSSDGGKGAFQVR